MAAYLREIKDLATGGGVQIAALFAVRFEQAKKELGTASAVLVLPASG